MWAQQHNDKGKDREYMTLTEETRQDDTSSYMNPMTAIVNKMVKAGYVESFSVTRRGLYSTARSRYYRPEQVRVVNFYRFEGESDPGDNTIMYVIETADGAKGTLVDAYGAYSDGSVNAFITEVEDIQKKMKNAYNGLY
jgi:hypothetical protein